MSDDDTPLATDEETVTVEDEPPVEIGLDFDVLRKLAPFAKSSDYYLLGIFRSELGVDPIATRGAVVTYIVRYDTSPGEPTTVLSKRPRVVAAIPVTSGTREWFAAIPGATTRPGSDSDLPVVFRIIVKDRADDQLGKVTGRILPSP
jgi:hypothetical protein